MVEWGILLEIKYELSQDEDIQWKIEARKILRMYNVNKSRITLLYMPLMIWILCPIELYYKKGEEGLALGIQIAVIGILISFLVIYFLSNIILEYLNRKGDKVLEEIMKKLVKSQAKDVVKVTVTVGKTVKIKGINEIELSYTAINGIIENKNNIFIEYLDSNIYPIPAKAFSSVGERYDFVDVLRKNYEKYRYTILEDPKSEKYDFYCKYIINSRDIKNITAENSDSIIAHKIFETSKKNTVIFEMLIIFLIGILGVFLKDSRVLLLMGVFSIVFYYYNKILLPISSMSKLEKSIKNGLKNRYNQHVGINREYIYFRDSLRGLKQKLDINRAGIFKLKEDYLVYVIDEVPSFYIPYRAFENKEDIERFIDYFK